MVMPVYSAHLGSSVSRLRIKLCQGLDGSEAGQKAAWVSLTIQSCGRSLQQRKRGSHKVAAIALGSTA